MSQKRLTASAGAKDNLVYSQVELHGVESDEKLTPRMARRAARVAFGHSSQVTVWDNDYDYGYRLYRKSARKLVREY